MKITLDPGHGGTNIGTSDDGFIEKEVTLSVAKILGERLQVGGHECFLTRSEDSTVSLRQRGEVSRRNGCDLAISIHVNALFDRQLVADVDEDSDGEPQYVLVPKTKTRGVMAFHWPSNIEGFRVASVICANAPEGMRHRKPVWPVSSKDWTRHAYNVVSKHPCTAVLVEIGFRTNPSDRAFLNTFAGQEAIAECIAKGVK